MIDFGNSYMTFFSKNAGNIARIQLDAACTLADATSGVVETFYLIAPCRAERMYLDAQLVQMPNYEFSGIFSGRECLLVRTHWTSERDNREYGLNHGRFEDVHLDVRTRGAARALSDAEAVVAATLENRALVAQTELTDLDRGLRAVLEYPVKTMNVLREPPRFQVDTGPLILPDLASMAEHRIEWFEVAYVVYNSFDRAEFILRKPVPQQNDATTSDYSVIQVVSARNEIICAD